MLFFVERKTRPPPTAKTPVAPRRTVHIPALPLSGVSEESWSCSSCSLLKGKGREEGTGVGNGVGRGEGKKVMSSSSSSSSSLS